MRLPQGETGASLPRDFSLHEMINSPCCLSQGESTTESTTSAFTGSLPRKCPTSGQEDGASLWEGGCAGHRSALRPTPHPTAPCSMPWGGAETGLALKITLTSSLTNRSLVGDWRVEGAASLQPESPALAASSWQFSPSGLCHSGLFPPDSLRCPLLRWEPSLP